MPYDPPPQLAGLTLDQIAEAVAARRLPPLDRWQPVETGESHMRIAADGCWWHQGSLITRPAMVRAFASLLTCDAQGRHWLMTPHQKLAIEVEDAAFLATDCVAEGGALAFRLNTDDIVIAGADHPLDVQGPEAAPRAYLGARHGCRARLDRSTWLQLAEIALAQGDGSFVTSGGVRFALLPE
ncbi:DUF1285 domain-containing protein [Qipengyuania sediminis]|uniref:DUF1285 domain-containing protein n=1 Tax=Qipengyuania sediminis TaxID=1532023 RepID=UPI00105A9E20|nr:DUF1285 domain-containing protein [Qipengyuania sediminis]